MASAFTKLFLPGHRKRVSLLANRKQQQEEDVNRPDASKGGRPSQSHHLRLQQSSKAATDYRISHDSSPSSNVQGRNQSLTTDSLNTPPGSMRGPSRTSLDVSSPSPTYDTVMQSANLRSLPRCGLATPDSSSSPQMGCSRSASTDAYSALGVVRTPSGLRNPTFDQLSVPSFGECQPGHHRNCEGEEAFETVSRQTEAIRIDDDDDVDTNPIYWRLSEDESLKEDWDAARLVLVPLQRCFGETQTSVSSTPSAVNTAFAQDSFISLHAFAPSRLFKDQFVSVRSLRQSVAASMGQSSSDLSLAGKERERRNSLIADAITHDLLGNPINMEASSEDFERRLTERKPRWDLVSVTASLEPNQACVHILASFQAAGADTPPKKLEHRLKVVAETTVYRTIPVKASSRPSATPRPSTTKPFEVVSRAGASSIKGETAEKVKIRVMSVEGLLVPFDFCCVSVDGTASAPIDQHHDSQHLSVEAAANEDTGDSSKGGMALEKPSPAASINFPAKDDGEVGSGDSIDSMLASGSNTEPAARGLSGDFSSPYSDASYLTGPSPSPLVLSRNPSLIRTASTSSRQVDVSGRPTSTSIAGAQKQLSEAVLALIKEQRVFLADVALLLSAPEPLSELQPAFNATLATLSKLALEFTNTFVFVKGFDAYNVSRIRSGIWFRAWKVFEDTAAAEIGNGAGLGARPQVHASMNPEASTRIKTLIENVVMGYVHSKLYGSIMATHISQDDALDSILHLYKTSHVGLVDLGVHIPTLRHRPGRLEGAIQILRRGLGHQPLSNFDQYLSASDFAALSAFIEETSSDSSESECQDPVEAEAVGLRITRSRSRCERGDVPRIRTPLDVMYTLKATIDEIGMAVQRSNLASSRSSLHNLDQPTVLSTDDLLPILAYVIIKACPQKLLSCLYYAQTFRLAPAPAADLSWALVTFEAVVEYLRTDPLQVRMRQAQSLESGKGGSRLGSSHRPSQSPSSPLLQASPNSSGASLSRATSTFSSNSWKGNISRERRVSMPAVSPSAALQPISPKSGSLAEVFSPGAGHLSRCEESAAVGSAGTTTAIVSEDVSPSLWQDGFKLPGMPASSSRRGSKSSSNRSGLLGVVGEAEAFPATSELSTDTESQLAPSSRQSSFRSRTTSLTAGSADLQIRPQIIVRPTRRVAGGSLGRIEAIGSLPMEKSLSSGSPKVRIVGSPQTGDAMRRALSSDKASPSPKALRRKSLDSWTALSFLGSSVSTATEEVKPSQDMSSAVSNCPPATARSSQQGAHHQRRPLSQADSISSDHNTSPTPSSSSWLPWSTDWGNKRPGTPGSNSVVSAEGVSTSSTFSSIPRSASGSGFTAARCAAESPPLTHTTVSAHAGRPESVRSISSVSSGPDEGLGAGLGHAHSSSGTGSLSFSSRRKHGARFLSTTAGPLPPKMDLEATGADFSSRPKMDSGSSLNAVMIASSPTLSSSPSPTLVSSASTFPTLSPHHQPTYVHSASLIPPLSSQVAAAADASSGYSSTDSFLPSFFRLHVPSPVTEIADPLTSESHVVDGSGGDVESIETRMEGGGGGKQLLLSSDAALQPRGVSAKGGGGDGDGVGGKVEPETAKQCGANDLTG